MIFGRNRGNQHERRLWDNTRRQHGFVRATIALTMFRLMKFVVGLFVFLAIAGCVVGYVLLTN